MLSISAGSDPGYLTKTVGAGAEHYYLRSIELQGEPPGYWTGDGIADLGLTGEVANDVFEDLYSHFVDPRKRDEMYARLAAIPHPEGSEEYAQAERQIRKEARLGDAPRNYEKAYEKRLERNLAAAQARTPGGVLSPEQVKAIEISTRKESPSAKLYYDLTFSAPKSWSVAHAALQVKAAEARDAGELATAERFNRQADQLWDAWKTGVQAGLEHMQDEAGYTRKGHHGASKDGRTSGEYVKADKFIVAAFAQHTSRQDDPQLHVHAAVLNKVRCVDVDPVTGREREVWRALDGTGLFRHKQAAGHIAERVAEQKLERVLGWRVQMRPDGKAREIVGVDQDLRDAFSSRRTAITDEVRDVARAYEEKYGVAPSAYTLARISEDVSLRQRAAKKHDAVTREQLLARWEESSKARFRASLADVPERIADESALHDLHRPAKAFNPEIIQRRAVAAVQEAKPSWTRPDLLVELNRQLPDTLGALERQEVRDLLNELADGVLSPTADNGVVRTKAPALVEVPTELQRTDGTFKYEPNPATFDRYATEAALRTEGRLADFAGRRGAPTVPRELVEAVIKRRGLTGRQAEFVRAAATSGRRVDLLVGPAGAGKSYTLAALTEVWEAHDGRRVIGLASGQRAAEVLRDEGVENVANIEMMLIANRSIAEGRPVANAEKYRIPPGALVIVDEAGMTANSDMDQVRALIEAAGAKCVPAGDHHQLTAVGAGGIFAQWVEDAPGVHVLDEVRRFRDTHPVTGEKTPRQWEADASLRLREGDGEALTPYELHGRFRGGSAEEMTERAYQAWLTDHLAGRKPLLIAQDNEQVAELSARVRADLVRAGKVSEEGVVLRTGREDHGIETRAGVGDLIQLRRNNREIQAENGTFAVNRTVAKVTGISDDGALMVRLEDGARMHLPASYVKEHVELAYAATVHGAQGRTVGICHSLVDESTNREALYVMLTRGEGANYGYVITHRDGDGLKGEEVPHHLAVLDSTLRRSGLEPTATKTIEAELDRREDLAVLEPVWSGVKEQDAEQRFGTALLQALGTADYERAASSEAFGSLMRLARHVEEQGFDAEELLVSTALSRELESADDVAKVLHDRLTKAHGRAERAQVKAEEAAQRAAADEQRRRVITALSGQYVGERLADELLVVEAELVEEDLPYAGYGAAAPHEEDIVEAELLDDEEPPALASEPSTGLAVWEEVVVAELVEEDLPYAGYGAAARRQEDIVEAELLDDEESPEDVLAPVELADVAARPDFSDLLAQNEAYLMACGELHADQALAVAQRQTEEREARWEAMDSYTARTPELDGEVGRFLQEWAVEMDERTERLGQRVAEERPAWAVDRLGPVPEDPMERADWERRAGRVERYREAHGYDHDTNPIGQAPPQGAVEARADWERARRALGVDDREADITRASDETLRQMVERAEREEAWAPPYVADAMQKAFTAERDFEDQAVQLELRAQEQADKEVAEHQERVTEAVYKVQKATGSNAHRQALAQAMALQQVPTLQAEIDPSELVEGTLDRARTSRGIAETMGGRARGFQEVQETRERWAEETQTVRDEAQLARTELERRSPVEAEVGEPDDSTAPVSSTSARSVEQQLDEALDQARAAREILQRRAQERQKEFERQQPEAEDLERERRDTGLGGYGTDHERLDQEMARFEREATPSPTAPEPEPVAVRAPEPPTPPAPEIDLDVDM
ncbi:MobF family relaxase [Streptomyces sp. NRRL F-5630]|uniref:MobF family relaxase n=1 Tax=Streptomyces sp. NRRL F-5630 TaxID=1463864 RepID=UPI003EB8A4C0